MDENVSSAVLPGHSLDCFYGGMGGKRMWSRVGNKKKDCVSMCASGFSWWVDIFIPTIIKFDNLKAHNFRVLCLLLLIKDVKS